MNLNRLNSDILIVCAGEMESFQFATTIGIGMVEPAINLTKILLNLNNYQKRLYLLEVAEFMAMKICLKFTKVL